MEYIKLGDLCEIINGYAFKSDKYVNSGVRIIRITNVQKGYIEDQNPVFYPFDLDGLEKYLLEEGDLLISLTGNVGRVAEVKRDILPAALNQRVACLRINSKRVYRKFLYYVLNNSVFEKLCIQSSKGIAQKNMSTDWLKEYKIPLFTYEEQIEIVNIFDDITNALNYEKQVINRYDELIQARFVEMFGDTVTNSLGWKEHRLDEYIDFLTSGSRGWARYFVKYENELFITIKNVKNNHIILDDIQYIEAPNNKEAARTKVKSGDLLISITADLGRTGVVDDYIASKGAYINQHLSLVRLDRTRINPLYVSYFLETDGGKMQFESKNQNGVKAGLNFDAIKSLKILVPPLDMQELYLDFVKRVDKSKFNVMRSIIVLEKGGSG